MSNPMYENSVALFIRSLNNLSAILEKGATFAAEQGIEQKVLAGYRLYPNMFPLTRQVQIACDIVKGGRWAAGRRRIAQFRGHGGNLRPATGADRKDGGIS